ncbi:two-component response regulator-like APRR9 [Macadamia integrifolia]|uniref:two-component response regulator-like APRR9 n=1 Tax=Macadamia integrifolia TaxID=60698 RepID=UPI001C4E4B87|nr:two-component response regulator-like APRR9 [Macadamia integrifolia]
MSSDFFLLDGSFFRNSSPDVDLQLTSEPLFSFPDPSSSSSEILSLQFSTETERCSSGDQNAVNLLSCSPPSQKLNHLLLESITQVQPVPIQPNFADDGLTCSSILDSNKFGLISEDGFVNFESSHISSVPPSSYSGNGAPKVQAGMIQRSLSSHSLDRRPSFHYHPRISSLIESPNFPTQAMDSPKDSNFTLSMRRACSTGDLQRITSTHQNHGFSSSPLSVESSFTEEGSLKVRKYNAEERKQRIHRYRSKRTQRNFNKTIKYACRKTLADSRPRVRGRFARHDESGEIPKFTGFNREEEDEDELWVDGFQEEAVDAMMRGTTGRGGGFDGGVCFNPTEFQYYGF